LSKLEKYISVSEFLSNENKKPTLILLLSTLLLITWKYYGTKDFYLLHMSKTLGFFSSQAMASEWYVYLSALVLLGLIPLCAIKFLLREEIKDYGLTVGEWKEWLPVAGVISVIMIVVSLLASGNLQFTAEYPLYKGAGDSIFMFVIHALGYLLFYFGWEILFRGFMQFGLSNRFGIWGAILVQTAISSIAHIGKPDSEIYGAIIGAIIWGILTYRYKTILPSVITHWILGLSLDFFICFT